MTWDSFKVVLAKIWDLLSVFSGWKHANQSNRVAEGALRLAAQRGDFADQVLRLLKKVEQELEDERKRPMSPRKMQEKRDEIQKTRKNITSLLYYEEQAYSTAASVRRSLIRLNVPESDIASVFLPGPDGQSIRLDYSSRPSCRPPIEPSAPGTADLKDKNSDFPGEQS
ncbi:MAG TPA: hypothetical protein HPP83_09940 [Candidatus Hydrogenedentes bacterium]|nr:hypothetical protein [Candidatus Hydrogenedentota bacterium]